MSCVDICLSSVPSSVDWITHIAKIRECIVYERRKTPIYRSRRGEGVAKGEDMVTIDEATSSTCLNQRDTKRGRHHRQV